MIPKVEGMANRADSREDLINCSTGIPSLDAGLSSYSLEERKRLADRVFGPIKIEENK